MGYGALIVGYGMDLNPSDDRDLGDTLDDEIRRCTCGELWLSGGEYRSWKSSGERWTRAFVCKTVSYAGEEYLGDTLCTISRDSLANMETWLRSGLPHIDSVKTMLRRQFPKLSMHPSCGLYLVLDRVNATTSTHILSGSMGSLRWSVDTGWKLDTCSESKRAQTMRQKLQSGEYDISMDAFRRYLKSLGDVDEEDYCFDEFVLSRKSDIIDRKWCNIINFYEDTNSWDIIFGSQDHVYVYKDTHTPVDPSLFRKPVDTWFQRTWQSG